MPQRTSRPHVLLMSEITTDGKLTLRRGASSKILTRHMDPAAVTLLHRTRAECDAIMVGANTVRIDDPYLTVRGVQGRSPLRVIPNSMADLPLESNVFGAGASTLVAVTAAAPAPRVAAMRQRGAEVVVSGAERVDLPLLMRRLFEDFAVRRMMVEGGPTLAAQFFRLRLVDQIRLVHLPFIVGGEDTPSLVGGLSAKDESDMVRLVLTAHYLSGGNLVTDYEVLYAAGAGDAA